MVFHTLNFWELTFEGTQIFLCIIIVLLLIRKRIKNTQLDLNAPGQKDSKNFSTEFLIQSVRQQSELAFKHIRDTIEKEHQRLEASLELQQPQITSKSFVHLPTNEDSEVGCGYLIYGEIEGLASQGLSPEEISEKLDIPRAEVELILRLKQIGINPQIDANKIKE
jgi:hypothetical protein